MFLFVVLFLLYFLFLFLLFFFFFIFCWFLYFFFFFFSSRRRHTRFSRDWSSDVCSSDLRRCPPASHHASPTTPRCFYPTSVGWLQTRWRRDRWTNCPFPSDLSMSQWFQQCS